MGNIVGSLRPIPGSVVHYFGPGQAFPAIFPVEIGCGLVKNAFKPAKRFRVAESLIEVLENCDEGKTFNKEDVRKVSDHQASWPRLGDLQQSPSQATARMRY